VTSLASLLWFYASSVGHHAASPRLMLVPVYLVSTNILIGRVFRNSTQALLQVQHAPPPAPPTAKLSLHNGLHIEVGARTAGAGHQRRTLCEADVPINRVVKISMDGGEREAAEGYAGAKRGGSPVEVEVRRVTERKTDFFGTPSESLSEGSMETDGHHMFGLKMC
jgi:hypothetical protein